MPIPRKWVSAVRPFFQSIWKRIRTEHPTESAILPFQFNRGWFMGGAAMVAGYILGRIDAPKWLAFLALLIFLVSAAVWPWVQNAAKRRTIFWGCFLLCCVIVACLEWRETKRSLEVRITPYVVVHRPARKPGWKLNSSYGLSVVIQATNSTLSPKQIQNLEVFGDVKVEFQDYSDLTVREGSTIEENEKEYNRIQPYRRLHWIAYPSEPGFVEAGSTRYIRFTFLKPANLGMRILSGEKDNSDFFGSVTGGTTPRVPTTSVHLSDLILFERHTDYGEIVEWTGPKLKGELNGKTFFTLTVDGVALPIQKDNINRIVWTLEPHWKDEPTPNLFWGQTGRSWDGLKP